MGINRFSGLADACRKHYVSDDPQADKLAEKLKKYLRQGDPLADALAEEFSQLRSQDQATKMLEMALEGGIGAVPKPPDALRAFMAAVEDEPLWLDKGLLELGSQTYLRCGIVCGLVLACSCLPLAYRSGAGNKPLMFKADLIKKAVKRLGETNRVFLEICAPKGLKRGGAGWKLAIQVRMKHAYMRRVLRQYAKNNKSWWEADEWGTPINQMDLAATSLLFSVSQLRHLRRVGFHFSAAESEGVMHLWRYAGHLLGIMPDLLCATEAEGRGLQQLLFDAYDGPDEDSTRLIQALMKNAVPGLLAAALPHFLGQRAQSDAFKGRLSRFCYGLSHGILGREVAESLGYTPTVWRYTAPALLCSVVAPLEVCRRFVPGGTRWAARLGHLHLRHMMRDPNIRPVPVVPVADGSRDASAARAALGNRPMADTDFFDLRTANTGIFKLLTPNDRQLLLDGVRSESYRRDQVLFREGDAQPDLYVLLSGLVRVERLHAGHPLAVARYGPGDVVGEVSFLGGHKAMGTVVAEEEVKAAVFDGVRLLSMLYSDSNFGFASRFYHSLAMCLGDRLVQIRPGIPLPDDFGTAGARTPRTGQLSDQQLPIPLIERVEAFRNAMRLLDAEIREGRTDDAQAWPRVHAACDGVVEVLNAFTSDDALVEVAMDDLLTFRDVADLARGVGGYVSRETHPFFMRSATIAQGCERPRGRAEDRDWLDRVERDEPEGDGRLGRLIDRWFLNRPLCRAARRHSVGRTTTLLRAWTAAPAGPGPPRVTSLSAGTAGEVFGLLAGAPPTFYATCIDADADALAADAAQAQEKGYSNRVTFLRADLSDLVAGRGSVSLGPQHVIYGLGVCDYLNDADVVHLLNWVHGLLADGGRVLLTNRDAANPDRAFTEHILDWPVVHRTADELGRLFNDDKSPFKGLPVEIKPEESGVNLFAHCRKNGPGERPE